MIRELKSENDRLKQFLVKAAQQGQKIDLKALGLDGDFTDAEANDLVAQ